ncbi:MAG: GMP/IMP nucleotidase [Thermodesulfovibrionales bacterium]|nr:GMP/IMP nucleotidase [Thermodesulfovibrionales bacterium]
MNGIPLKEIKYVLLDMDGTLLDKYFDDYFWEHLVPEKYAERNNITFGSAKGHLMSKYKRHEGTLNWTDIDFWSRELALDIPALKEQIKHLVEVHPHVEDFLKEMRRHGKKIFLLTNAHYKSIDIKFKKTGIGKYFDSVIASFDLGHPKESLKFWEKAESLLGFQKQTSLFIDDTEEVLKTARLYGIKYILLKTAASSKETKRPASEFPSISDFKELMGDGI